MQINLSSSKLKTAYEIESIINRMEENIAK
jgi:hypothetical protein